VQLLQVGVFVNARLFVGYPFSGKEVNRQDKLGFRQCPIIGILLS